MLKDYFIEDVLEQLSWLKDYDDAIEFEELVSYAPAVFYLEAVCDEDGELSDIRFTQGSYATTLRNEPDFWCWEQILNGNYVATIY